MKHFPGRIICIYIRDVAAGKKQETAQQVVLELKTAGVEMILTEHTVKAAEHAAANGLIFTTEIPAIVQDKKEDLGETPGKVEPGIL